MSLRAFGKQSSRDGEIASGGHLPYVEVQGEHCFAMTLLRYLRSEQCDNIISFHHLAIRF